jgi:hypothetical protein
MKPAAIRLWPWAFMSGEWRAERLFFQNRVIPCRRHRPRDAKHRRSAQIFGHPRAADPHRCGNLALTEAGSVLEAQNFSDLTHRQSLRWHGALRVLLPRRSL